MQTVTAVTVHVRKLVEKADIPNVGDELGHCTETDAPSKKTVSEVEPSATNQHFAGNVI